MSKLPPISFNNLEQSTLEELWELARCYGRVHLNTSTCGKYWSRIEFNTIKHVELVAKHESYRATTKQSLIASIKIAEEIVGSAAGFNDITEARKQLGYK